MTSRRSASTPSPRGAAERARGRRHHRARRPGEIPIPAVPARAGYAPEAQVGGRALQAANQSIEVGLAGPHCSHEHRRVATAPGGMRPRWSVHVQPDEQGSRLGQG
jgi:hypothetical protein